MCKPLVYRSRMTGHWTWDCEVHSAGHAGRTWENALWEALLHRWMMRALR